MSTNQDVQRITQLTVERATKLFGTVRALSNLSLSVKSREVVAVMGANGAGKSTLLSLLSLSARPTRGKIRFNGRAASEHPDIRRRIGLLSHEPMVYPDLTAEENLRLFAELYQIADATARVARLAEEMGLGSFMRDRPARVLSRGQLQRVSLARALINVPDLLLLDEPAAGLDSRAVERIEVVIQNHVNEGGMAVVVTHEPEVAIRIATRAVMMQRGAIIADAPAPKSATEWRELYIDAVGGSR